MHKQITPIILTYNEQANIRRTLSALQWAPEVLVVDSYSTDRTIQICGEFNNVRVVKNRFVNFAKQSNFALAQDIKTEWVLSMDADYIVTPQLCTELDRLPQNNAIQGYEINFEYLIRGKPLRGSLYPARTSLYRKVAGHYRQDGHTQRVVINGLVSKLENKLQHDDRKPYSRWLSSQKKYAIQEAAKLSSAAWRHVSWPDRLRYLGLAPLAIVPYTLLIKGLVFNGMPGLEYTGQRLVAEVLLQAARCNLVKN